MDAKEAINRAKAYAAELFSDEKVINIGLEELAFDDSRKVWEVTVGFSRPWDAVNQISWLSAGEPIRYRRTYKVVEIADSNGSVMGISNRAVETADA